MISWRLVKLFAKAKWHTWHKWCRWRCVTGLLRTLFPHTRSLLLPFITLLKRFPMSSAIARPASFGSVSGTAFASASPEALARILDSLDVSSLELEHTRLQRAIKLLEQSNKEITEFITLEQQELREHHEQQQQTSNGDTTSSQYISLEPDPEFVLAIEENKAVIAKYDKTCAELMKAIQRKGGSLTCTPGGPAERESVESNGAFEGGEANQDGVYL